MKIKQILLVIVILTFAAFNVGANDLTNLKNSVKELTQQNAALAERVDELEFETMSRIYSLSGYLETNYENLTVESPGNEDEELGLYGLIARLNFDFDVNDKIQFHSSLGMSKFWQHSGRKEGIKEGYDHNGDGEWDSEPWEISQSSSYNYSGPGAVFDRAYFNFTVNDKLTLSVGRLPTQAGPPEQQLDGKQRTGTLPRSARNSVYDGVALTYSAKDIVPKNDILKFKFYYIPWTNVDEFSREKQLRTPPTVTNKPGPNERVDSTTLSTGLQVEYFKRNLSWVKEIETHLFTLYYKDFWWNQWQTIYHGYTYTASVGFNGIMNTGLNFNATLNGTEWWTEDNEDDKIQGRGYLFNINYKFKNNHVLGTEYITTNDKHYADDFSFSGLTSMYKAKSARGFHAWWSAPLYQNLRMRAGAIQYRVTNADNKKHSYYAKLMLDF